MSPILITFLGVLLLPLFVASWRMSLVGLASQGALLAWVASRLASDPTSVGFAVSVVDLGILRGVIAPVLLYRVMRAHGAPPRNDVIPANLLSWTAALALVLVAFQFAERMVPDGGDDQTLVAVACSGVLLAMLVLGTKAGPFSQIVGVLRLENAIALFELGSGHHESTAVRAGQLVVAGATVLLFRWYLVHLPTDPPPGDAPEGRAR